MCARCAREVAEGGLGAADDRRRGAVRRGRVSTRATPLAVVKAMARMQYVLVAHQVVGSAEPARTIGGDGGSGHLEEPVFLGRNPRLLKTSQGNERGA